MNAKDADDQRPEPEPAESSRNRMAEGQQHQSEDHAANHLQRWPQEDGGRSERHHVVPDHGLLECPAIVEQA